MVRVQLLGVPIEARSNRINIYRLKALDFQLVWRRKTRVSNIGSRSFACRERWSKTKSLNKPNLR